MRIDVRQLLQLPVPTLLLGALNIAIGAGVLLLVFGGTRAAELLATPGKPPAALKIELANAPPQADLAAIQAQPLMHSTRAFYVPPPPNAAPVAPPLPEYRLAGSFISPNKPAVALLANPNGTTRRVHKGDDVDGWSVQSIEGKRVVLRWQEQTREIGVPAAPMSSGLRRMPIQRSRVASSTGTTISLGAGGTSPASGSGTQYSGAPSQYGGAPIDRPRVYRPPPN